LIRPVHTVGIDRVIGQAGVAKASLCNTFGSEDELVRAYLQAALPASPSASPRRWNATTPRASACRPCSTAKGRCSPSRATAAARSPGPAPNPIPVTQPNRPPRPTGTGVRTLLTELAAQAGAPEPEVLARQLLHLRRRQRAIRAARACPVDLRSWLI
jgi:AcrR family transcriptional regulator